LPKGNRKGMERERSWKRRLAKGEKKKGGWFRRGGVGPRKGVFCKGVNRRKKEGVPSGEGKRGFKKTGEPGEKRRGVGRNLVDVLALTLY